MKALQIFIIDSKNIPSINFINNNYGFENIKKSIEVIGEKSR